MDLADAIRTKSTKEIKEIIDINGLPIDSRWIDYEALNTAIRCQRKDVAKYLLEKNCRVNKIDYTNTPLHNAVVLGDVELVHELLEKGALTLPVNPSGNTPLHTAFIDKKIEIIDLILASIQENPKSANLKNNQGLSHMHVACTSKNVKVVENFIRAGVNIQDSVSNDSLHWKGYTALHFATGFKSRGAVKLLLEAGANIDTENANHQTPLQLANEDLIDSAMIVDALSKKQDPYNCEPCVNNVSYFHMACLRNDPNLVKKFIEKGAEVNTPIKSTSDFYPECTALHFAVMANQEENIKILLSHGAFVDHFDYKSMTPLHYALYNKNRNKRSLIVDWLHESVDDKLAESEDKNGLGYFHVAIVRNDVDVVKDFLDGGYNVNRPLAEHTPEYPAYYPLHFAARYQYVKMAALLMKRGADVNKISWDGTPLHIAFELANHRLIKMFWSSNANVKLLRPKDKKTMLHLLVQSYIEQRNVKCNDNKADVLLGYIGKLVDKGVNVNAKTEIFNDDHSDTALHLACRSLHLGSPCVKLLLDYGADINLRNTHCFLPNPVISRHDNTHDDYCGNADDYMMIYNHVQKLKALGLHVEADNEEWCELLMKKRKKWDTTAEEFKDETIIRMEQERTDEINRLKSIKLTKTTSLRDFLLLDAEAVVVYANNNVLKEIVESKNVVRDYSSYGYLILLQYKKAVSGAKVEGSIKRSINSAVPENSSKRYCLETVE